MTVGRSILLFTIAGLFEIGGCWLIWQGIREHRGLWWVAGGIVTLGAYGLVVTFQPSADFGRILAAYGGVFIAASLAWDAIVDGYRPDRWDIIVALICLGGVSLIMYGPRTWSQCLVTDRPCQRTQHHTARRCRLDRRRGRYHFGDLEMCARRLLRRR